MDEERPLPRIATQERYRHEIIDDTPAQERVLSWTWPVGFWIAILANATICSIAILGMWKDGYLWYIHLSIFVNFCATLAALAFIYKYILGYNNNVRPNN